MSFALNRSGERERVHFYHHPVASVDLRREVLEGLQQQPRTIHPKFFYDAEGAGLFEQITTLPEYYPTRCERQILRRCGAAISACAGTGRVLIEPGSGSSRKVELLLDALRPDAYVALDIAAQQLREAALRLARRFPWLEIHAVAADYSSQLPLPPALVARPRLVFYPGSTIGNFEPAQAQQFLRRLHQLAGPAGALLIGVDLEKDSATLERAYDDSRGVTAAFNRNALHHLNRVVGSDFVPERFRHVALFNRELGRIEMHLESIGAQRVRIGDVSIELADGERIHTENSYKYSPERFAALARSAGFTLRHSWYDRDRLFGVHYLLAH
jgi:dimethylhistidine N-methyltransferase